MEDNQKGALKLSASAKQRHHLPHLPSAEKKKTHSFDFLSPVQFCTISICHSNLAKKLKSWRPTLNPAWFYRSANKPILQVGS